MRNLFFILLTGLSFCLCAQSTPDADIRFKSLSDKSSEFHRRTDGEYDGYRIKIYFGIDKTIAQEVKQKFTSKYNDIPAYIDYKQPNHVVVVGNFKTRVEAFEILKKIQSEFPNAFITKSKIKPNK
ncbi:MAG TPA: SPOR domain-containing protein [Bacteroidia bacterium]|jgi:hypothetical protein|nr:SPOR domain-containing protein [Bacteroidia bacterium]